MTTCLNCGGDLTGRFCAHCGQRDVPPRPTLRELIGDAYGELVGWDGKLVRTLVLLVRSPGALARAILDGHRVSYISPVRLYLACSLLYFLVSAAVPDPNVARTFDVGVGVDTGASAPPSADERAMSAAMSRGLANLDAEQRALVQTNIAKQPVFIRSLLTAMVTDPDGLRRRAAETMPRVLFALVPALACVLALFYRGRTFPEHLYFAVLFQSFVFLVLTLESVTAFAGTIVALAAGQIVQAVVIAWYGVVAQRRVYGGSWPMAVLKGLGVGSVYFLLWSAAVLGVTIWVS
jgi:hypothetical protein